MNEHDKDGLPFSIAAQRSESEDNETVTARVDFNEFLVRRQLLAMESKENRITAWTAEDWLKSRGRLGASS